MSSCRSRDLPENFKEALIHGTGDEAIPMNFGANGKSEKTAPPFEGLIPQMQRLYQETESEFTRNRIRAFMTRVPCQVCEGARLKPEILAVTIQAQPTARTNIHQFSELTIEAAARFIAAARADRSATDDRRRRLARDRVAPAISRRSGA